jgi:gliding motility-associated-like protein
MRKNKALAILCLLLGFYPMQAQIDTEFWFAAPEVTSQHADRPIYLRISSLNKAATITISQPANPGFTVLTRTIPANSSTFFDLTDVIDLLENGTPDFVDDKGLFIKSTAEITAYYEVYGTNSSYGVVNTDIFVLKGRNALGTEFYTPFQTYWRNNTNVNGWSSFDIVATENNTIVTITPTQNLVGHAANVTFSVTLNKGETYSSRAAPATSGLSGLGPSHPAGSHVTSNKPIAITVKDDSLLEGPIPGQQNYDLAGDQIVPVNVVGKEYVVIKSSGTFNDDRIFICATQNNTDVFIDGNPVAVTTLATSETYIYKVNNNSSYITTSQPVYIFHISSLNGELGGALLPPLACTGSKDVRFSRNITGDPTNAVLKLNLIVKAGKESYFKLNGNPISTTFSPVPGSSVWVTAQIIASDAMIPEGSNAHVSNDSASFHLGVTSGIYNKSFEYGYFSDYGSLDLGPDQFFCKGGSTELDAGIKDQYSWSTGSKAQTIIVSDSGKYFVNTIKGTCSYSDTVSIHFYPEITGPILGNDTAVCASGNYIIKTDTIFPTYLWQNGSKSSTFKPSSTGYYSVQVSNTFGCTKTDSIFVKINANPVSHIINIKDDKTFCADSSVVLDAGAGYIHYSWMNGDTSQSYSGKHINEDKYWVTVTDLNKCSATDTFQTDCSVYIEFPNLITPNGDTLNDVFFVKGLRPGKWSLEVFNRWGDKVYLKESYDNTWNGKNDTDGIYYFHLRHVKGIVNYKGWVEILRDEVFK